MSSPSDQPVAWDELRQKILGLGERSVRKSHYPQLQERLAELERFRALLDASGDMILLVQLPSGRLADVNESACRNLHYNREQMLRLSLLDVAAPATSAWAAELLGQAPATLLTRGSVEASFRRCDGSLLCVEVSSSSLPFDRAAYAIVVARDITERKRAEQALRLNEDRLRQAAEAANIAMWHRDLVHGTLTWTHTAQALFGLPPEASVSFAAFLDLVHPEDRQRVEQTISLARADPANPDIQMDYRIIWPDGSVHWIMARGRMFYDKDGRPLSTYGVVMNITARKAMEAQLEQAKASAEAANRTKDDFLAVLSHELRTPLAPVLLTASLLENRPGLPLDVLEDVQTISRNVQLEARIIDDLLDLTRIARGKLRFDFQPSNLHLLIRSAVDICGRGPGASIVLDLQAEQHLVYGDPARLQQVFWNLLNNARKFTPASGVIAVRSRNAVDRRITVQVIDTGVGIAPEVLPKIFGAFEQAEAGRVRRFGGLGLGLAICKAIVDAHGGTIVACSAGKGLGATFTVQLPLLADAPPPLPQRAPSRRTEVPAPRRLRILLVEDHQSTLKALTRLLQELGHTVRPAASRQSAVQLAQREAFDLIISDLGLPDGSGHELMRSLKARSTLKGIAVSGYGMPEDVRKSREAGFSKHLTKPVTAESLQTAIAEAMCRECPQ